MCDFTLNKHRFALTIEKPTGSEEIAKARLQIICRQGTFISKFSPLLIAEVDSSTSGYGSGATSSGRGASEEELARVVADLGECYARPPVMLECA